MIFFLREPFVKIYPWPFWTHSNRERSPLKLDSCHKQIISFQMSHEKNSLYSYFFFFFSNTDLTREKSVFSTFSWFHSLERTEKKQIIIRPVSIYLHLSISLEFFSLLFPPFCYPQVPQFEIFVLVSKKWLFFVIILKAFISANYEIKIPTRKISKSQNSILIDVCESKIVVSTRDEGLKFSWNIS